MIYHGDCLEVMAAMEPESVDAIVTDPPYDLTSTGARKGSPRNPGTGPYSRGFMGKAWDGTGIAFRPDMWEAAFRVARPSSYLLAFGGTRTVHRMATAIEDAGWIIRDMLVWAYASGFPKSKANLKPAWEPIVMARKPGPLRMLAIDECRIEWASDDDRDGTLAAMAGPGNWRTHPIENTVDNGPSEPRPPYEAKAGRWPANVILTDPIFDGGIAGVVGGGDTNTAPAHLIRDNASRASEYRMGPSERMTQGDSGTYSRFFLIPKADRSDREPAIKPAIKPAYSGGAPERTDGLSKRLRTTTLRTNQHPTVKPTELMRHLVRLVTPSGGTVLDPFLGSGTTGLACELEGFPWIGIEREAEYVAIAEARLNGTQRGLGLSA